MQSAPAKLAAKLARRQTPSVAAFVEPGNTRNIYNSMFYEVLLTRIDAVETQDRTLFGHIWGIGLGILG